jgi:sec-independent protein translocase protein TatA
VIGDILQPTHLLFILVVALLVLGPKRLPEVGRSLGRGLRDFKAAVSGEDRDEVPSETGPLNVPPPEPAQPLVHAEPPVHAEPAAPAEPPVHTDPAGHAEPAPQAQPAEAEQPTAPSPAGQQTAPAEQPEHVA